MDSYYAKMKLTGKDQYRGKIDLNRVLDITKALVNKYKSKKNDYVSYTYEFDDIVASLMQHALVLSDIVQEKEFSTEDEMYRYLATCLKHELFRLYDKESKYNNSVQSMDSIFDSDEDDELRNEYMDKQILDASGKIADNTDISGYMSIMDKIREFSPMAQKFLIAKIGLSKSFIGITSDREFQNEFRKIMSQLTNEEKEELYSAVKGGYVKDKEIFEIVLGIKQTSGSANKIKKEISALKNI